MESNVTFEIQDCVVGGRSYIRDFLDELEQKNKPLWNKTNIALNKLKNKQFHKLPLSETLGNGLNELRVKHKNDIVRINYCFGHKRTIFLLNGLIKKDKKRQQKIIKHARELMIILKKRMLI